MLIVQNGITGHIFRRFPLIVLQIFRLLSKHCSVLSLFCSPRHRNTWQIMTEYKLGHQSVCLLSLLSVISNHSGFRRFEQDLCRPRPKVFSPFDASEAPHLQVSGWWINRLTTINRWIYNNPATAVVTVRPPSSPPSLFSLHPSVSCFIFNPETCLMRDADGHVRQTRWAGEGRAESCCLCVRGNVIISFINHVTRLSFCPNVSPPAKHRWNTCQQQLELPTVD